MKYKLISKTLEETICSKVVVDGFDYYVNDGEILQDDYWINLDDRSINSRFNWNLAQKAPSCKKVIATNNPNIDLPQVIDEKLSNNVIVMAQQYALDKCQANMSLLTTIKLAVEYGYNKSQKTHSFSEDDMLKFMNWVWRAENKDIKPYFTKTSEELFKLWKEQQIKTIYYG